MCGSLINRILALLSIQIEEAESDVRWWRVGGCVDYSERM